MSRGANLTLWQHEWRQSRLLLLGCTTLVFAFGWTFVWLQSLVDLGFLGELLRSLPNLLERISPVPFKQLATPAGMISILYVHPLVLVTALGWSITRGSGAISGELDRGTMEMLMAQPISRLGILFPRICVTVFGSLLIGAAVWMGNAVGIQVVTLKEPVRPVVFLPAALNLMSLGICVAGITTLASSWDRYRWRTIACAAAFVVIEMVLEVIARGWPRGGWLRYATIFAPYEPQPMVFRMLFDNEFVGAGNVPLLIVGGLGFALSSWIFHCRDLPAPV